MSVTNFRGVAASLGCAMAALSCSPNLQLGLPDVGEAQSLLVFVEQDDKITLHAMGATTGRINVQRLSAREEARIHVVTYAVLLSEMLLAPGDVEIVAVGRSIPTFDKGFELLFTGAEVPPWSQIGALPKALQDIRLAMPVWDDCLSRGGCIDRSAPRDGFDICRTPCSNLAVPAEPAAPAPPAEPADVNAPALPVFAPCPIGWIEVGVEGFVGLTRCEGPAQVPELNCGPNEARFAGESTCRGIGTPCSTDPFASDLPPNTPTVFVDPAASSGGDGSRAAPFVSLATAINAAPDHAIIALSSGTFTGPFTLARGQTLWGRCVSETLLTKAPDEELPIVTIVSLPNGGLRNLSAQGSGRIVAASAATVQLRSIRVEASSAPFAALRIDGGTFDAQEIIVRGAAGVSGMVLGPDAAAHVRGSVFEQCDSGLLSAGGHWDIEEVALRGSRRAGLQLLAGGQAQLARSEIARGHRGVMLAGLTTSATVSQTRLSHTSDSGFFVAAGAYVHLSDTLLLETSVGIAASGEATRVDADRVQVIGFKHAVDTKDSARTVLRDLLLIETSSTNLNGLVFGDAEGHLTRAAISQRAGAIRADHARLHVEDLSILETATTANPLEAMIAVESSTFTASRLHLRGPKLGQLGCTDSKCSLEDFEVSGEGTNTALGLAGGTLRLERARIRGSIHGLLLGLQRPGDTVATDVSIHLDHPLGRGITLVGGAAELSRVNVLMENGTYVLIVSDNATLIAKDVRIQKRARAPIEFYPLSAITNSGVDIERADVALMDGSPVMFGSASQVVIRDAKFRGGDPDSQGLIGMTSSSFILERAELENTAIQTSGGYARLADVRSRNTLGGALGGNAQASLDIERLYIEGAAGNAITLTSASQVRATDLIVSSVRTSPVCDTACGDGLLLENAAVATVERFLIRDCARAGVGLFQSTLSLVDGDVRNNKVGVLIHSIDVDLAVLLRRTRLTENQANVQRFAP